ncbi:hypothetical protein DYBT9275_05804 [Dyadobacter sp. CECT 9275]|uniref:Methyltransferase domain-containing protein n=1 Tax=Dyadobacter helix TaxID=2822344 RepID=A0A916JGX8_9BACT|nr:methyltransferase domain-containing protein [Dyadobacter sp. CECT 9275]CAG5017584.1 hypothetical protein DYBT9275_05804 [Dyadobacter sp. CECT 9275]
MFKKRSQKKELLDAEDIPPQDLFVNLKELDFINKWLGGYGVSFSALKKVLSRSEHLSLVDIGSGGGDTLKRINTWAQKGGFDLALAGVDIKPVCTAYAKQHAADPEINFFCDDYRNMDRYVRTIDIIHASLFCHHFSDEDLTELVRFALAKRCVLIINDLERHPLAYYSIKFLTALFSNSYLVKNDAPLSVLRGFKKKEWKAIVEAAGAMHFTIRNKWAFRHEVIVYGNRN